MQKLIHHLLIFAITLFLIETVICGALFFIMDSNMFSEYIKEILIGVAIFIILLNLIINVFNLRKIANAKYKTDISSLDILGNDIQKAYDFGKIGLIMVDKKDNIIWTNTFFNYIQSKLIDKNIFEWEPRLKTLNDSSIDEVKLLINNKYYSIKYLSQARLYIFKDITALQELVNYSSNHLPVIGIITIDNYQDLTNLVDNLSVNDSLSTIQKIIVEFAKKYNLLLKKYKSDSYLFICNSEDFKRVLDDNVSLLEEVRKETSDDEYELTLSIGISSGLDNYSRLFELASNALDVALSRGGNQAVISSYGENLKFIGGVTEAKEKKNSVQSRVMSNSLTALIQDSSSVYLMGHNVADLDAIGACLGLYCLASVSCQKVKIVYDEFALETKTKKAMKQVFSKEQLAEMTILPSKAIDEINSKSLLILADVHNPDNTISPSLVKKAEKIAIVDHHRRGEKSVEKAEFNYIEPSASSASEMVIEMIRFSSLSINVPTDIATFMLAGIFLDTNFYRNKISARTFDASYVLKNFGADNALADSFLKEEYEEYALKTKIMSNSITPYYGVVISKADSKDIVEQAMLARVAKETLQISGINACFVIGRVSDKDIGLSSRSDGTISCQLICEKLGGGGSFTASAARFQNLTIEEVENELKNVLDQYLNDARKGGNK